VANHVVFFYYKLELGFSVYFISTQCNEREKTRLWFNNKTELC